MRNKVGQSPDQTRSAVSESWLISQQFINGFFRFCLAPELPQGRGPILYLQLTRRF